MAMKDQAGDDDGNDFVQTHIEDATLGTLKALALAGPQKRRYFENA
jgi:hypothetical protein